MEPAMTKIRAEETPKFRQEIGATLQRHFTIEETGLNTPSPVHQFNSAPLQPNANKELNDKTEHEHNRGWETNEHQRTSGTLPPGVTFDGGVTDSEAKARRVREPGGRTMHFNTGASTPARSPVQERATPDPPGDMRVRPATCRR